MTFINLANKPIWMLLLLCFSVTQLSMVHGSVSNLLYGYHKQGIDNVEWWVSHGNGLLNHRHVRSSWPPFINKATVVSGKMKTTWTLKLAPSFVSATPAIADGAIYFPAWNGNLYALDKRTGAVRWSKNLTEMIGSPVPTLSRTTPALTHLKVDSSTAFSHHRNNNNNIPIMLVGLYGPSVVVAVDRRNGGLIWKTAPLDDTNTSIITMSGTVFEGYYFVGTSSSQELFTCCTFQGSFQKIRIQDGTAIWKTSMLPPNSGYYGAPIWGSSPSIDVNRRYIYLATGNNYQVPPSVEQCYKNLSNNISQYEPDPCYDPNNHHDSICAIHVDNGSIVWCRNLEAYDVFILACLLSPNSTNCPQKLGPDYDFGEAPMLLYIKEDDGIKTKCIAVTGQKSGAIWALDCDNGSIIWSKVAGPGGTVGGASWGMCTDGKNVYTNIINNHNKEFILRPGNNVTTGGGWVGLDGRTGQILWSTATKDGSFAIGPLSMANGIIFAGSFSPKGDVYALDALSGSILWQNSSGAPIYGGFSIDNRCIYGGNGYRFLPPSASTNYTMFAFCIP